MSGQSQVGDRAQLLAEEAGAPVLAAGLLGASGSKSLTGVRAIAAGWVLLFHLDLFTGGGIMHAGSWSALISRQGAMGVDFFYVLSGFILAYQYLKVLARPSRQQVARFLLLRLARIYPLHLLTMAMVGAIIVAGTHFGGMKAGNPEQLSPSLAVANLLLVHAWGFIHTRSWNEVSWSISCEWFAYLCLPLLAVALSRVSRLAAAWLICIVPLLLGWLLLRACGSAGVGDPLRFGMIRISSEFVSGCGALLIWQRGGTKWLPPWTTLALVALLALVVALQIADPFAVPIFPLLILSLVERPSGTVARTMASPAMVFLGEISYGIYMLNQRIMMTINRLYPLQRLSGEGWAVRAIVGLALCGSIVLAAALTFRTFEEPIRLRLRHWIDRRFPAPPRTSSLR